MSDWNQIFSFILPTKIIFGPGCLSQLPEQLSEFGCKRPLIITDRGIAAAGVLKKVTDLLKEFEFAVYDGVEANPKDRNVVAGAMAFGEHNADCILAVGGGSPIDCAKAVGVLAANGSEDIKAFEGKNKPSNALPVLIAVPTTAGTGSELTFSSVITDTKSSYKMTVKNAFTAPKLAICDPELTLTVPSAITAATGIDALTHAIEAFSATCSEPLSDAAALYAVELICGSLRECCENGSNLEARSKMLMGSMLAGIAFSHSDVGSVHCIAESLGGMFDLAHGVCNAVILPYMMEYNLEYCRDKYSRIAKAMGAGGDGENAAEAAVKAVKQLAKDVGLPEFKSFKIDPAAFESIAEASAINISTQSNPRPMSKADYLNVLRTMAEE